MQIDGVVRDLGPVNHTAVRDKVLALDEKVWLEDDLSDWQPMRGDTRSIVLLFCDGWEPIVIDKRNGWPYLSEEVVPLATDIIDQNYAPGGRVLRAMIAKLIPGGTIKPHVDAHPSFSIGHRIHVPLKTNDDVQFVVEGQRIIMEEGKAYELNNLMTHGVHNGGKEDRIHLIFDYMEPL